MRSRSAFSPPWRILMRKIVVAALADCLPSCLLIQVEKGGKRRKTCIRTAYLVDSIDSVPSWQSGGRGFDPRQLHQLDQ